MAKAHVRGGGGIVAAVALFFVLTIPVTIARRGAAAATRPISPTAARCSTSAAARPATPRRTRMPTRSTARGSAAGLRCIAVRHLLRAEYFVRSARRHRRLERSRLRHRALERHLAPRPASFSGIPLHVLPAHAARRRARSVCLSENAAAGRGPGAPARFGVSVQYPPAGRALEAVVLPRRAVRARSVAIGAWNRGAYLVNGPGHCAECHSPRNSLGAIIEQRALRRRSQRRTAKASSRTSRRPDCSIGATDNIAWSRKGYRRAFSATA